MPPGSPFQTLHIAEMGLASRMVHADDHIAAHRAVAPAMHVSTTFRYNEDPEQLQTGVVVNVDVSAPRWSPVRKVTRLTSLLNTAAIGSE